MRRIGTHGITLLMASTLLACGGEDPVSGPQLRQAPLWMADAELPGCVAPVVARPDSAELLAHPRDAHLVLVVEGGRPVCIAARGDLFQPGGDTSGNEENEGQADDDPIPVVRLVREHTVADDPIPVVRERDIEPVGTGPQSPSGHTSR